MYSDVEAMGNILEYLLLHSLIFRLSIYATSLVTIFYFIRWISFSRKSKDIKEEKNE